MGYNEVWPLFDLSGVIERWILCKKWLKIAVLVHKSFHFFQKYYMQASLFNHFQHLMVFSSRKHKIVIRIKYSGQRSWPFNQMVAFSYILKNTTFLLKSKPILNQYMHEIHQIEHLENPDNVIWVLWSLTSTWPFRGHWKVIFCEKNVKISVFLLISFHQNITCKHLFSTNSNT